MNRHAKIWLIILCPIDIWRLHSENYDPTTDYFTTHPCWALCRDTLRYVIVVCVGNTINIVVFRYGQLPYVDM